MKKLLLLFFIALAGCSAEVKQTNVPSNKIIDVTCFSGGKAILREYGATRGDMYFGNKGFSFVTADGLKVHSTLDCVAVERPEGVK